MQQDGDYNCFFFVLRYLVAFAPDGFNGEPHQVHSAQCMMKTGMQSAGIDQMSHPQLFDMAQPLDVRMLDQIKDKIRRNGNETIDRIINNFFLVQYRRLRHKNCYF